MRLMVNVFTAALAAFCLANTAFGAASPAGTTIPSATQIIDSSGRRWTLSGGVVYENGSLAGRSANVTLLIYDNGKIYHQNSSRNWYFWCVDTWLATNDPRDGGTKLEIRGTARASDVAGAAYTFVPTIINPGSGTLKFAIKDKPSWISFDTATGILTGTPNLMQLGTYHGIVVSVSNGRETAYLPQFSISVTAGSATLDWIPPTHTKNGTPIRDLAGYTIYYGTSPDELTRIIDLADPTATGYVISNLTAGRYYFAVTSYTSSAPPSARSGVETLTIQ